MNTTVHETSPLGLTPAQHHRLMDEAKREALQLRRDALREWTSAVGGWLRSLLHKTTRRRLQA